MHDQDKYKKILLGSFDRVVKSSVPEYCMAGHIPSPPALGKTYVVGAGKAAAKMAQVFERLYTHPIEEGVVVTRYGHAVPTERISVIEASHPIPDMAGCQAAQKVMDVVSKATADDLVVFLLSGGGSSLMSYPCEGISLQELQNVNTQLLKSGAPIAQMNTVRKHLNQAFGGKLARAAFPARVLTLSISDVPGDDPAVIASGPTVGDPSTLLDARQIIEQYNIQVNDSVMSHLNDEGNETPLPEDKIFENTEYVLIATPQKSLEAAAEYLQGQGLTPYILSADMEGDTNECAAFHVYMVEQVLRKDQPFSRGCAIISGGETTVRVTGTGDGGPNTQFMLQSALLLDGAENVYALACDTDGIDGSMDNAGAIITPDTLACAKAQGISAKSMLADNNSYNFFKGIDDLVVPGPTHTNVNDYRVFIIVN